MLRPSGVTWLLAVGAWGVLLAGSFALVHAYVGKPGPVSSVVAVRWPTHSQLGEPTGVARLLVFVHPSCPCTDATLSNLSTALGPDLCGQSKVDITLIISGPAASGGCPPDLQRKVQAMGAVTVRSDGDGRIAREFGAATSGHVVWSDGQGRLGFSGGITPGRGHVGQCESLSLLIAAMQRREASSPVQVTPVYGCPIFDIAAPGCGTSSGGSSRDIPMCCEQP